MTGRVGEAKTAVDQALALDPDVSIERKISDPASRRPERVRLIEAMRKAGFPACANRKHSRSSTGRCVCRSA